MLRRAKLRRVSGALIVVLLLASVLALNISERAGAGGTRCQLHRLDARARSALVTGEGPRTVVIGDSWSVGRGQQDLGRSWPRQLPGEVHVAGFSGSGFSARASGCGRVAFADRAPGALATHPQLVVVQGGLNDYDQPATAIEHGFRALMAELAGQQVVIVGPADAPARTRAVPRVDALLAMLSAEYGVPYIVTSDLELTYLPDQLHLTDTGHRTFGEAVAERIAAVDPAGPSDLTR